ncbi:MAG: hypothetical protein AB8B55_22090 [Mariniblastus sp.]
MNTENAPKRKKSLVSIPFIVIGLLLVGMMVPVMGDVDGDSKADSVGKYLMYTVISSQENKNAKGEAIKGEKAAGPGPAGMRGAKAEFASDSPEEPGDDKEKADDKKEADDK